MVISYQDAAKRHWDDAVFLHDDRRAANADQLFGLAAECALKEVMVSLGASTTGTGDLGQRHQLHIDKLWSEYHSFAAGRRGSRYLTPLAAFTPNPFDDWTVSQRYAAQASGPSGAAVDRHRRAARACLVVLQRAASQA